MKRPPPGAEQRIANMSFAKVYPLYVAKVTRKGRTRRELNEVIEWLTGYDEPTLTGLIDDAVTIGAFFERCRLNPNSDLITGVVCGYRVESLENPLIRHARFLDKLVDELAKGWKMEKILRGSN